MFGGIGWPELVILLIAALVILGPERLPGAIQWTMNSVRQARNYISDTAEQLRSELGPEVNRFREPLSQLNELREMSPRDITTKYLLDGDDSIFTGEFENAPAEPVASAGHRIVAPVEFVDPANCGVVRPGAWLSTAEPEPPPDLPPIDADAT
ncbi:twin arginine-targeting protein translocase TatB [Nocardia sp. 852002-20019_SCH5090214]|uniref:Sec-independent protein translocase protein TatB n=1 Tax=Nocardia sp. 852002-20019_SCH5090214 TaxID=1834087 RepID=UPI0007EA99AA|nr:Sec-independent protein translocase protein TatB [Nocardia sp. 852002-20019_SCH5090214]OBA45665.1 twin arginine-targeting protein translocase TatB [Nocardia sp. 852002-20019_SCH5090214]